MFETETAWIASLQLENGAIPMTRVENGEVTVNPYFADFAALALLDNADKYAENVRSYMNWHFQHLNTEQTDYNGIDGTIYDYKVTLENGKISKEESKGSYDSTDSYAATFLMVLEKYYDKTGDGEYIVEFSDDIVRIVNAMLCTLNRGLTYAKPDYKVKYLMDNCEVYEGLVAAKNVLEVLQENDCVNSIFVKKCKYAAEKVSDKLESKLWSKKGNYYKTGIFADNNEIFDFSWEEFYPSATAQLFPVSCGVISPDTVRAYTLYNTFCENYNWESMDIPSEFCWGANVLTAAIMGDVDRVSTYMQNYCEKYFVASCFFHYLSSMLH